MEGIRVVPCNQQKDCINDVERKKMGQKGFWDEQERREKLHQKKPMLKWLNEHINWEDFRPI